MHRLIMLLVPVILICTGCGGGGGGSSTPAGPTARVTSSPPSVLPGGAATVTVTFSEAVTGMTAADLAVTGGTTGAFTVVSPTTYTLDVMAGAAGTTAINIALANAAAANAAGVSSAASTVKIAIANPAWATTQGVDSKGAWAVLRVAANTYTSDQRFRLISPGTFVMGSPTSEVGREADETQHTVILTTPFWIAETECTQAFWRTVTNTIPSSRTGDLNRPVENMVLATVTAGITTLNGLVAGLNARLPTESEWEFAARAGTTSVFGISPVSVATINVYPRTEDPYINVGAPWGGSTPVGALGITNAWGLYDMHGNVMERCLDFYGPYPTGTVIDPIGPLTGTREGMRGGTSSTLTYSRAVLARSASRNTDALVGNAIGAIHADGLRLVIPVTPSGGG